jgi:branched-chain amino acid transport system permease protein
MDIQFILNSIVAACRYALVASGFTLIFSVGRFFHMAHGAIYTLGAYVAYALLSLAGIPPILSIPASVAAAALVGGAIEVGVYRPLQGVGGNPLVLLVASLGILISIQNVISLVFGEQTRVLSAEPMSQGPTIAGGHISWIQVMVILVTAMLTSSLWLMLVRTSFGRQIRAVASDHILATIVGIRRERVISEVYMIGSALAGLAGILIGYDTQLNPMMGFRVLLVSVVAAIVGGIGSIPGALLGGTLVGFAENFGVRWLPTQWQDAIVFLILVVVLILRPQGILGKSFYRTTA